MYSIWSAAWEELSHEVRVPTPGPQAACHSGPDAPYLAGAEHAAELGGSHVDDADATRNPLHGGLQPAHHGVENRPRERIEEVRHREVVGRLVVEHVLAYDLPPRAAEEMAVVLEPAPRRGGQIRNHLDAYDS